MSAGAYDVEKAEDPLKLLPAVVEGLLPLLYDVHIRRQQHTIKGGFKNETE